MNKKAQLFNIALVGITAIVLLNALVVIHHKKAQFKDEEGNALFIGKRQFELFNVYSEGENILTYIDQVAKFAAQQSVYDLGKNSGFFGESKCGSYAETNLWNNFTDYCFPNINKSFIGFLSDNLNEQLENNPYQIPKNNYDFVIEKGEKTKITGIATANLVLNRTDINYSIKPSFSINIDALGIYDTLQEQSIDLVEKCSNIGNFIECINNKKEIEWEIKGCGNITDIPNDKCREDRIVSFYIETGNVFPVYDAFDDENKFRDITIKFALEFPDIIPPPKVENVSVKDTEKAENSVTISWDESKADDVKEYKIYYSRKDFEKLDEENVMNILDVENDVFETEVTGMEPYDHNKEINEYYFAVTALDFVGNENKTVEAVKGQAIDDLKPNKVSEVKYVIDGNKVVISWDKVTNEDNSEALDVKYQIMQLKDDSESTITTLDKDKTSYEFTGLETGIYKFGVKAVDETLQGTVVWSDEITI